MADLNQYGFFRDILLNDGALVVSGITGGGDAENGIASGGTTGQILSKVDDTNYNTEWIDAPTGGGAFPFTGSAEITGSLNVINSATTTPSLVVASNGDVYNRGISNNQSNTVFGENSLRDNGSSSVAFGYNVLPTALGSNNIGIGYQALTNSLYASNNIGIGGSALNNTINGSSNVGIGYIALRGNTSGAENVAVGLSAMAFNTTGQFNVALGSYASSSNGFGNYNVAVGYKALTLNNGSNNTAIGTEALANNDYPNSNTAVGRYALRSNTTGGSNTAVGDEALRLSTATYGNTSVGQSSLRNNTTGNYNTAVGQNTQSNNFSGSVILGWLAESTANNQFVVGSTTNAVGAVTTETVSSTRTWSVVINGVARKILLA